MAPTIRICSLTLALALTAPVAAKRSEATPLRDYLQARVLDAAGDPGRAAAAYSRALTAAPGDAGIAVRAYRQAIEGGDKRLALRAAVALRDQQTLPPDAQSLLLLDAFERGDWAAARLRIDRIEAQTAYDFLAPSLRALTAFGAGERDWNRHLDLGGGLASAFNRETRILLLLASGQWQAGVTGLRLASTTDGRSPYLKLSAAAQLARLKQVTAARDALAGDDPALGAARARLDAGQRLDGAIGNASGGLAFLLLRLSADLAQQNRSSVALALARIGSFAEPDNDTARVVLARSLMLADQPSAALALLDAVEGPLAASARMARIDLLLRDGREAEAIAQAKRAGADAATLLIVGEIHARAGRHRDAARTYEAAIDAGPPADGWEAWMSYGAELDASGDWPAAKRALETALRLAPEEPIILNQLGYAMLERGDDLARATQLIAKANRLQPDNAAITDSLGWAFHLRGQTAEAIPLLERAAAQRPDEAAIGEHLGDAYWAMGRKVEARYAWNAALVATDEEHAVTRIRARLLNGPPRAR